MSRVYRAPWKDFPDVVVQTTIAKLKAHRDYANAKAGDPESGIRVVSDLLKPGKVKFKIDAIVPVLQFDVETKIITKLFHFCGESPQEPFNNFIWWGQFCRPEWGGKSRGSNNNDSLVLEPPAQVCDGGSISHNVIHDKHPDSCFQFSIKHRLAEDARRSVSSGMGNLVALFDLPKRGTCNSCESKAA